MARRPGIAIGGISHETNTFAASLTTMEDVRQRTLLTGEALLANARGTDGELGGIVDAAEGRADILPTLFASAAPGGPMDRETWTTLRHGLISRITTAGRRFPGIDGAILVLHGALVVDGVDDAEGALLHEVRALIGNRLLIVVVDFHANLSPAMVAAANLIVPYRTYPHLDTRACGVEALNAWLDMIGAGFRSITEWRPLPIRFPLPAQITEGDGPFAVVARLARQMETRSDVRLAALIPGFPYSDATESCASVLVTTDNDPSLARVLADKLASALWQIRHTMQTSGLPLAHLDLLLAEASTMEGPVVLADIADNPGAGAPGDSTWLLHRLFASGQTSVVVASLVDPVSVAACYAAGHGSQLDLAVGGRAAPSSGSPMLRRWTIRHLGEGVFANNSPIGRGSITRLGRTATIESDGISVILCERRVQTLEPAVFQACGIDPLAMRTLVVKSSVHYRAAFGPIASQMIDVETPGLCISDLATLPWTHSFPQLEENIAHAW